MVAVLVGNAREVVCAHLGLVAPNDTVQQTLKTNEWTSSAIDADRLPARSG
jgi:hypothetical protein